MPFVPTDKQLADITMRPKQAIHETHRAQGIFLTDETFALRRRAVINDKPLQVLLDKSSDMAGQQDAMLEAMFEQLQKAHLVPMYVDTTVYQPEPKTRTEKTIKDPRRMVSLTASKPNRNDTMIDADKLLLLRKVLATKGVEISFWQEANKPNAPIAIMRQDVIVGLIMPCSEAKHAKVKRDQKAYNDAMYKAAKDVETTYYGQPVSTVKRALPKQSGSDGIPD